MTVVRVHDCLADASVPAQQLKIVKYLFRALLDSGEPFLLVPDMERKHWLRGFGRDEIAPLLVAAEKGDLELLTYFAAQGVELDVQAFVAKMPRTIM